MGCNRRLGQCFELADAEKLAGELSAVYPGHIVYILELGYRASTAPKPAGRRFLNGAPTDLPPCPDVGSKEHPIETLGVCASEGYRSGGGYATEGSWWTRNPGASWPAGGGYLRVTDPQTVQNLDAMAARVYARG